MIASMHDKALLVLFFSFFPLVVYGDVSLRVVAVSGQEAPGTDTEFASFGIPVINDLGQIAFTADLAGDSVTNLTRRSIWSEGSNEGPGLQLLARGGEQAAGFEANQRYSSFTRLVLNDSGQFAFSSGLSGPNGGIISDYAVWSGSSSNDLRVVASFGQTVAGTDPPTAPRDSYGTLALNNRGDVAFRSGITSPGRRGLWSEGRDGTLKLVVRSGEPAPDDPQGLLFAISSTRLRLNDLGTSVFHDNLTDGVANQPNRGAIYTADVDGGLQRIVGPHDSLTTDRGVWTVATATEPRINNRSEIAYRATIEHDSGTKQGILVRHPIVGVRTVAVENDPIPGSTIGERFSSLGRHELDRSGGVAFDASISGGVTFERGIFAADADGNLTVVARSGWQASGAQPGVVFDHFFNALNQQSFATNANGEILVNAILRDSNSNELVGQGIWVYDRQRELLPLLLTGQTIDVSDSQASDLRTVSLIRWTSFGNNQDGLPSGFNDRGQVALAVQFIGGSSAIVVAELSKIPEPKSLLLLFVGSLISVVVFARRRLT